MINIDAPPRAMKELGVGRGLLTGLVLRHLAAAGTLSGAALEDRVGVPLDILEPILAELTHTHFIERKGHTDDPLLQGRSFEERFNFHVTGAGRKRAAEVAAITSHYLGPCPISVEDATLGLYSATQASKGVQLIQPFGDGITDIVTGRRPLSDLDTLLREWKSAGADTMKTEYEKAYAATQ